jgi:hypothetical protein
LEDNTSGFDVRDMTTNYPFDLYPNPEIVKAINKGGDLAETEACLRTAFPGRRIVVGSGFEVRLTPQQ